MSNGKRLVMLLVLLYLGACGNGSSSPIRSLKLDCGLGCAGPCFSPIEGDPPCPCEEGCVELPIIETDAGELRCYASFCFDRLEECMQHLHETTDRCLLIGRPR